MCLTNRGGATPTYEGAGAIIQRDHSRFEFELYDSTFNDGMEPLDRSLRIQAGQWIPEDYYYDLEATDFSGCIWSLHSSKRAAMAAITCAASAWLRQ